MAGAHRDGRAVLADLLAPLGTDRFLAEYYERQPLVACAKDPERFAGLLSVDAIDAFLASADVREGMVQLSNHHAPVDAGTYIDETGRIRTAIVAREYARGATIVINQLHESDYALGQLTRAMEEVFSAQATTNIYLTPPANQGFPPHYDNHDVLVLQVSGAKKWRLWETPVETPYRGERFEQSGFRAETISREFTLGPGDVAYIPRGVMHDAENVGEAPSLHITVGLFTKKWADLMLEAVSELALTEPSFRRSLPPRFAAPDYDRDLARASFDALVDLVAEKAGMDGAFDLLTDAFIRARRPDVRGLVSRPAPLPDARYRRRAFVPWNAAEDEEGRIVLIGPGGDIAFAPEDGDALERALSGEIFTLADLVAEDPEAMLRLLWSHGYLERVEEA